jgi:hypothetical protein
MTSGYQTFIQARGKGERFFAIEGIYDHGPFGRGAAMSAGFALQ